MRRRRRRATASLTSARWRRRSADERGTALAVQVRRRRRVASQLNAAARSAVEVKAKRLQAARVAAASPVGVFPSFVVDAYAAVVRGSVVCVARCVDRLVTCVSSSSLRRSATVWPEGLPAGDTPVAIAARTAWYLEKDDVERALGEWSTHADADLKQVGRRCAPASRSLEPLCRWPTLSWLKRDDTCVCASWSALQRSKLRD